MAPHKSTPRLSVIKPLESVQTRTENGKVTRRTRNKKMYSNEKCTVCGKQADGVKYNAISCDSCRVFFRRIILFADKNPGTEQSCKCHDNRNRHRDISEVKLMLKCQKCRLEKCLEKGMEPRYVTGHSNYNDQRTVRSVKLPGTVQKWNSDLQGVDYSLYNTLLRLYHNYLNGVEAHKKDIINRHTLALEIEWAEAAKLRSNVDHKTYALRGLRASLHEHIDQVKRFFKVLSDDGILTIDEKLQNEMTLKSYGDCVVIRWCENFDEQRQSIKGINGKEVNMEQLKAMGFWNDCQDYLRNMRKLRDAKVDREDLALLCFLCVLTGDRGIEMTQEQRNRVFDIQYKIALLLDQKCKFEGAKNKLARLFQIVTNLRTDLHRQIRDFRQILGWENKIISTECYFDGELKKPQTIKDEPSQTFFT